MSGYLPGILNPLILRKIQSLLYHREGHDVENGASVGVFGISELFVEFPQGVGILNANVNLSLENGFQKVRIALVAGNGLPNGFAAIFSSDTSLICNASFSLMSKVSLIFLIMS
ncbi:MAG: hypothetical protein KJO08_05640 [Gammaproteobacteria bacterium]|nr:hypothetical protein [Gammaproteobacteria bacterium]NNJ84332.1 hypothetical protein [Gammaproteobacteria bacterium]